MTSPRLPARLPYRGKEVALKYHKLLSGHGRHPANSLSALREVVEGRAAVIEFDVNYLADGDFALNHDATLERETSRAGPVRGLSRREVAEVRLRGSDERIGLLSEAVEVLRAARHPLKLQIDFKEKAPLDRADAERFLKAIEPLRANSHLRVVVGCLADWNLREFRRLDPDLDLGLDFAFHLDAPVDGLVRLPTRQNAYGYLDDHPLGFRRTWPVERYLRDRVETLLSLVPDACEFYLRKDFVEQALGDGFNPVGFIHDHLPDGYVDVWTIDHGEAGADDTMRLALEAGADQITTNTAVRWAEVLGGEAGADPEGG